MTDLNARPAPQKIAAVNFAVWLLLVVVVSQYIATVGRLVRHSLPARLIFINICERSRGAPRSGAFRVVPGGQTRHWMMQSYNTGS